MTSCNDKCIERCHNETHYLSTNLKINFKRNTPNTCVPICLHTHTIHIYINVQFLKSCSHKLSFFSFLTLPCLTFLDSLLFMCAHVHLCECTLHECRRPMRLKKGTGCFESGVGTGN